MKKAALDSGVHPEAITPEGVFQPDYDEVLDTIMPSICYTPTAPGIEKLEVINVSIVLGRICVYVLCQKSNTPPHVDQTKLASVVC